MSPSRQYPAERQHPASSKPIDFSPKMQARHRELLRRRKRFFDLRTRHRKGLMKGSRRVAERIRQFGIFEGFWCQFCKVYVFVG
jgi:hypothetical protein